jgi:hypothetical protein
MQEPMSAPTNCENIYTMEIRGDILFPLLISSVIVTAGLQCPPVN